MMIRSHRLLLLSGFVATLIFTLLLLIPKVQAATRLIDVETQAIDMPDGLPALPSPRYECGFYYYYDDTADPVWAWRIPGSYDDDFYNTRFTVDAGVACTLKVAWLALYAGFMEGDPDLRVYLWDDDGSGFPGAKLDSVDVPYASLPPTGLAWVGADFSAAEHVFAEGEEFHLGWTTVGDPTDVLAVVSDDATARERNFIWAGPPWAIPPMCWLLSPMTRPVHLLGKKGQARTRKVPGSACSTGGAVITDCSFRPRCAASISQALLLPFPMTMAPSRLPLTLLLRLTGTLFLSAMAPTPDWVIAISTFWARV
jgi:hypothetical protein